MPLRAYKVCRDSPAERGSRSCRRLPPGSAGIGRGGQIAAIGWPVLPGAATKPPAAPVASIWVGLVSVMRRLPHPRCSFRPTGKPHSRRINHCRDHLR